MKLGSIENDFSQSSVASRTTIDIGNFILLETNLCLIDILSVSYN